MNRFDKLRCAKGAVRTLVGLVGLLAVTGCDREPEGQVVAVVNGDEITVQELNGELPGVNLGDGQDQASRNLALERVVERRLLAEAARAEDIEATPEYILREKKLQETLLAQMLNEKLARDVNEPSAQDVDRMIADNPQAFRDRTLFAMDQILFQNPERTDVLRSLGPAKTMEEVVSVLNRAGVKFQRGNATVDSASLPKEMFVQFKRVGTSEPMIIPSGQMVTVAKILATRTMPLTGDRARPLASTGYKRREIQDRLKKLLATARADAEIRYQSGYGKPAEPASSRGGLSPGGVAGADAPNDGSGLVGATQR